MDALTLLKEHVDVEKVLTYYDFDKIMPDGEFLRSCCKIHGGSNPTSFVINVDTGLWYCHAECGGGDIYTLVQHMEGCTFVEAVNWIAKFFNVDINNLKIQERQENYLVDLKKWMKLVRERKNSAIKTLEPFHINEVIKPVAKYRDFAEETLEFFQLGFVEEVTLKKRSEDGFYKLKNRLVIPIIHDGIQVGLSFRRTKNADIPKWSHQPVNIETGNLLYNYDNAKGKPEIVVVEGIFDVWAYHEIGVVAVATFGAHLSAEQERMLLRTGADITLSFDGDKAGREATNKVMQRLKYKANIKVVPFQEGEDPQSIGRMELVKRYESRRN